ncbi:MAG: CocE/NonD family hydrolase [Gemmatimonadaceae bacterium]
MSPLPLSLGARFLRLGVYVGLLIVASSSPARLVAQVSATDVAQAYIDAHADIEDMVMIPMRDGVRLYHLIFFPKGKPRQNLPTVIIRTPYLIDARHIGFTPYVASFLAHDYAVIWEYERGRFFSEGTYTFLVRTAEDGADLLGWITKQPWSNGKVGAIGCSSSAEEQHRLNAANIPGLAAVVPMGSGAGIGRVGAYNEMGNFYRGGAVHLAGWVPWYYDIALGNPARPVFPSSYTRQDMIRIHQQWNLMPEIRTSAMRVDSAMSTLPINQIMNVLESPPSDFDNFVNRLPNDPRWRETEFGSADDHNSAPALYINSWYDISMGPNAAIFEHAVKNAATEVARNESRMVIAPTLHCSMGRGESEHTIVGERDMGDARFDYVGLVQDWFDHFLKGVDNSVTKQPRVRAYLMGANQWRTYDAWPPKEAHDVAYYLDSDGGANTRFGNGRLTATQPAKAGDDRFTYDPLTPVPTYGGGTWCCYSRSVLTAGEQAGAYDQSGIEMRSDVLVYTTPPLTQALEVTGPVKATLFLSSDRKDTDLTIKLIDVDPQGRAYMLDETIQRVRWREGWDHPVFMEPGQVYKVDISPMTTSNTFLPGHRIRVEVSSSNFPHFERNLNTGGNNFDEKDPLIAHNVIHHGPRYPSSIVLPVVSANK